MKLVKTPSILLADDEPNIRMMLRTTLESDGYVVTETDDGKQALSEMRRRNHDVMILDLNMPQLDGIAVLEAMQTFPPHVAKPKVVILTAYGSVSAAVNATRLGAVDFLEKPITPDELRQTVEGLLAGAETAFSPDVDRNQDEYDAVVQRIRQSLRLADFTNAETLLTRVAQRREQHSAEYFNLLGILYEVQRKWRLAQKCYGKAMKADKHHEPAKANMRRIYELHTFGHSTQLVVLGDEPGKALAALLPIARS